MLLRRALLKACEKEERLKRCWIVEGKEAGKGVREGEIEEWEKRKSWLVVVVA